MSDPPGPPPEDRSIGDSWCYLRKSSFRDNLSDYGFCKLTNDNVFISYRMIII